MSDISVGDKMLVRLPGLGGSVSVHEVERVYKPFFVCAGRKWMNDHPMQAHSMGFKVYQ